MSDFKDIYLTINHGEESVTIYPKTCQIKRSLCNENLQHEESSVELTINYEPDVFRLLALSDELEAVLNARDGTPLFTGIINSQLSWEDMGDPCPVDSLSVTIRDYTNKLEQKTISEIGYINSKLEDIIQRICDDCSLSFDYTSTGAMVPAFVLDQGASYKTNLDNLLFQYGFCYFFDAEGVLKIWDFKEVPLESEAEDLDDSEIFMSPKISRLDKKYKCITVKYNTLTKKTDELVYYAGSGYQSDNTAAPAIVQKNTYYPFESDPNIESDQGKVQQSFSSGYAESYKKYNGETAYRRSSTSQLVYTEKHRLVEDWEKGNIQIDRTDFGYRQAAVRLLNTADEDAQVYSISIRADAWYRDTEHSISCGTGTNEYVCESEFIFDSESAASLVRALNSYFCGVKYKAEIKTDRYIIPGTFVSLDTGLSGFRTLALAVSSSLDADLDIYSTTLITLDEPVVKPLTRQSRIYTTLKGEKGDRGEPGLQGLQGERGEQGIPGTPGTDGTNGKTSYFHIKYSSKENPTATADMTETPSEYIGTYVDYTAEDSTDPAKYKWMRFQGLQGAKGEDGLPGKDGTDGKTYYLHIAYANSSDGKTGFSVTDSASKLYIGQYTDTTVKDSTDPTKYKWTIIKGEKGDKGATGAQGLKGDPGATGPKGDSYWVKSEWIDLSASKYDVDTWYPVVGSSLSANGVQEIKVSVQLNSGTKPSWSTNNGGFAVDFHVQDQRSGWGTTPAVCLKYIDTFSWTQATSKTTNQSPVSYTQMKNSSLPVLYLRGGGKYFVSTTYNCSWSIKTTTYTSSNQSVSPSISARPTPRGTYIQGAKGETGAQGPKGATGNFTKRIPLYYVGTSATAPAAPTARITTTGAATTTTWTQGKYTSFAVGKYYYTCEQIETYNSAGTFQNSSWSAVSRDTEYENAGTAKLRAAGKYIGKLTAAGTANGYTASSNWDWFLTTSAITINNFGKAGTSGATVAGNVYVWNGSYWAKDSDTSHLSASMNDMIALVDTYTTNATSVGAFATVFAKTIAAKSAFIKELFAKTIIMQTNGIIRGGSRYKDDGTLDSNHWAEKGFFLRADGTLKARMESEVNDAIIIGTKSGPGIGNGTRGVFIGTEAGCTAGGFDNIAIGYNASKDSFVGYNVAIGTEALMNGGGNNVAIGYRALKNFNSSSHRNVAIGYEAGGDTGSGGNNIFIGDSARSTESQNNVIIGQNARLSSKAQTDVLVAGNILLGRDALLKTPTSSDPATGNILIGDAVYINSNSQKAVDNIIIGKSKTLPQEGNAQIPFSNTININDIIKYLPSNFKLNKQTRIANAVAALILPQNVYCKINSSLNENSFARLDGVVDYKFDTSFGYIKYANGLLIQWGVITSSGTFAFPSAYKNRPFFVGIGRSEADGGVDYDEIAHAISETEYRLKYHYSDVDWLAIGISS